MAQLTLMDAVDGLQQGLDYGEKLKERATRDAACKAINSALDGERTRWIESQKAQGIDVTPEAFKPDQGHYFNASMAASQEYAKAGDWRGFMDQQVKLAPLRLQARAQALQDFKLDGDLPRLVNRFYQTVPDGGTIQKIDMVDGSGPGSAVRPKGQQPAIPTPEQRAPGLWQAGPTPGLESVSGGRSFDSQAPVQPPLGLASLPQASQPAAPAKQLRIVMGDGRVVFKSPDELLKTMTAAIQDPVKAAERDAELAMFYAKNAAETRGKVVVEREKGSQERQTAGVQHGYKMGQIGLQNQGELERADLAGRYSLAGDRTRAGATVQAAQIGADAQTNKPVVYGPEQSVAVLQPAPGGGRTLTTVAKGGGKRMSVPELMTYATRMFGDQVNGSQGGSRIGSEKVATIAARANQIRNSNSAIPDDQALLMAAGEHGVKLPLPTRPALGQLSASPAGNGGWSITRE